MIFDAANDNPFRQPEGYWTVKTIIPRAGVDALEEAWGAVAVSVSSFEDDPDGVNWQVEALYEEKPDEQALIFALGEIAKAHDFSAPAVELDYLEQRDWVSEVATHFPPIDAGRYYVYGSHVKEAPPEGRIAIRIDAGAAFGSGEHETTRTCLKALDALAEAGRNFTSMLDMGCGSAILAIAMAKTWEGKVLAADIDAVAVEVSAANAEENGEAHQVVCCVSDGCDNPLIEEFKPYDLITANILANPLIEMAESITAQLAEKGVVVLSGFLERQLHDVRAAYEACGLKEIDLFGENDWRTLVMQRG